jgi:hypothetical protein
VWRLPADDGTIAGTIRRYLREAGEFFCISPATCPAECDASKTDAVRCDCPFDLV